jgi:hypothetical protein
MASITKDAAMTPNPADRGQQAEFRGSAADQLAGGDRQQRDVPGHKKRHRRAEGDHQPRDGNASGPLDPRRDVGQAPPDRRPGAG